MNYILPHQRLKKWASAAENLKKSNYNVSYSMLTTRILFKVMWLVDAMNPTPCVFLFLHTSGLHINEESVYSFE